VRELVIGVTDMALQTALALAYALPVVCLVGIAVHVWPQHFGVLGAAAARKGFAALMWAVWLFAIAGFLLLYFVSQNYARSYGYGFIPFAMWVGPSLILSLIGLVVRHKVRSGDEVHG